MMLIDDVIAMMSCLHEHLWSTWSYDFDFAREKKEKDDVYKTKGFHCRFPMNSGRNSSVLREWYYNRDSCRMSENHRVGSEGLEERRFDGKRGTIAQLKRE